MPPLSSSVHGSCRSFPVTQGWETEGIAGILSTVVIKLQRLTTEYDCIEDRVKISGETRGDGPIVLWLTNRLATRTVPQLLRWLENQAAPIAGSSSTLPASPAARRELQNFAQAAAVAELKQREPVVATAGASSWIVKAIDISATRSRIGMTFRGDRDQAASVSFDATALRQWLSILHRAWSAAQWPPLVWPDWVERATAPPHDVVRH